MLFVGNLSADDFNVLYSRFFLHYLIFSLKTCKLVLPKLFCSFVQLESQNVELLRELNESFGFIQAWIKPKRLIRLNKCSSQRIFIYKELTAAPFVVTTSVYCCRKPEAIRKTMPEPLLAEWWTIFVWGLDCTQFCVRCTL